MNNQLDTHDSLDQAVRSVLGDIVATTPASSDQPTAVAPPTTRDSSTRPFMLVAMAAAAAAIVGVGSVMVATSGGDEVSPASSPQNIPASPAGDPAPTGPLLSTPLAVDAVPYIVAADGWELTDVYSNVGPLVTGGFEGATVFVGDGSVYDAPVFAATVVDQPQDGSSIDTLISEGEPVEVAGTTGAVHIVRAGTSSAFLTIYWPLDDTRYARFSAKGLTVADAVTFANSLTLDGARLTMDTPTGYRPVPMLAMTGPRRSIALRFSDGTRELELNGDNRGVASLLSSGLIADKTTTRTVNGVEVASVVAAPENTTSVNRIYWTSRDWSFYVMADGFTNEDEVLDIVGSLTLTDPETFAAAAPRLDIVMPGIHTDLAAAVLGNLGLSDAALSDAATTDMPLSTYHYGFELVTGAYCILDARRLDLPPNDDEAADNLTMLIDVTLTSAIAAGHPQAEEYRRTLLDAMKERRPQAEAIDVADCPTWATTN